MLPIFDTKDSSTRDKIISILATEPGINTKRISASLKKQYALNVTYQAVHKTLKQMVEQGVLAFDGKSYVINEKWMVFLKQFIKLVDRESKNTQDSISSEEAYQIFVGEQDTHKQFNFSFKSFKELDLFISKIGELYFGNAKIGDEFAIAERHIRHPIMFSTYHKILQDKFKEKKLSGYVICEGNTILDNWAIGYFSNNEIVVRTNAQFDFPEDELIVFGEYTIRIYYSPELRDKLTKYFYQVTSLSEFYPDKFLEDISESGFAINLNVQKDGYISEQIKLKLKRFYLNEEFSNQVLKLKKLMLQKKPMYLDVENLYITSTQVSYYKNFIVPYLTDTEIKIIDEKIVNQLPYEIFKQNNLNIYNMGAEVGLKAQKIITDFYKNYLVNFHQINLTTSLTNAAKAYLLPLKTDDFNLIFHTASLMKLSNLSEFKKRKEPGIFLLLDYNYGNYNPDEILESIIKILKKEDIFVFSLQFSPEDLKKSYITKLMKYYAHRYEGVKFDCGILLELGFGKNDLEMQHKFNHEERRIESYSIIKQIPQRLVKEVKEIGLKKGDVVMNYFSRKPSLSMVEKEISAKFNYKYYIDSETNVGVLFCRLK